MEINIGATKEWFDNPHREYQFNNGTIGSIEIRPDGSVGITLDKNIINNSGVHEKFLQIIEERPITSDRDIGEYNLHYIGDSPEIISDLSPNVVLGNLLMSGMITQEEMTSAYKEMGLSPQSRARSNGNGFSPLEIPNTRQQGITDISF